MAHNVVDGDAAGESDTALKLLCLLALEGLVDLSFDVGVNRLTNGVDVSSFNTESNGLF